MNQHTHLNGRRPFYRRRLIVDPKLQFELAGRAAGFCVFVLIVLSIALFAPMIRRLETETDIHVSGDVATVLLYMHAHFWPVAAGCVVIAVLGSILQSHRIAGPMVRVKRHMVQVGRGQLPRPLRTRHRDYLKAEVDVLNDMVAGIAERIEHIRLAEAALGRALDTCVRLAEDSTVAGLHDAAIKATEAGEELRRRIHAFRWEDEVDLVENDPIPTSRRHALI